MQWINIREIFIVSINERIRFEIKKMNVFIGRWVLNSVKSIWSVFELFSLLVNAFAFWMTAKRFVLRNFLLSRITMVMFCLCFLQMTDIQLVVVGFFLEKKKRKTNPKTENATMCCEKDSWSRMKNRHFFAF